ncbi:CLUMA_CG012401, isoform A [Clunio marinus]|uniref:CLUMA_CG012401, isoform A n=1 Tax=Clunio marinus TaxID=568069 RepID=A0A1J1IGR6_9DIPT|nr:CLUMA_CG012401, isoform A [Clunio marinus]
MLFFGIWKLHFVVSSIADETVKRNESNVIRKCGEGNKKRRREKVNISACAVVAGDGASNDAKHSSNERSADYLRNFKPLPSHSHKQFNANQN